MFWEWLCVCAQPMRRLYNVASSLIGWAHAENDPWCFASMWQLSICGTSNKHVVIWLPEIELQKNTFFINLKLRTKNHQKLVPKQIWLPGICFLAFVQYLQEVWWIQAWSVAGLGSSTFGSTWVKYKYFSNLQVQVQVLTVLGWHQVHQVLFSIKYKYQVLW